jgi:DNA anti-recombination protein RmuC
MFIPDFVYSVLDEKSFHELAELKVVPTNTSGLLSTIFMVNMQHRFTKLNSAASHFGDLQIKVCQCISDVIDRMTKGSTQLQHCFNNLSDAMNDLKKLNATLETLSFDEVDNAGTNFR